MDEYLAIEAARLKLRQAYLPRFRRPSREMKEFATGPVDPDLWDWFVRRLYYLLGDGQDPETAQRLKELLTQIDKEHGTPGNYFYYLATAPGLFAGVINQLGMAGLTPMRPTAAGGG
jgi:glucose-6-phosphate 1-dehydrogenase